MDNGREFYTITNGYDFSHAITMADIIEVLIMEITVYNF